MRVAFDSVRAEVRIVDLIEVGAGLRRRLPNRPSVALEGETGDAIKVPLEIQRRGRGRERPRIGLGVETGDAGANLEIITLARVAARTVELGAEHAQVLPIPNLDHTQKSHQRKRLHYALFNSVGSEHVEFFFVSLDKSSCDATLYLPDCSDKFCQQLFTVWTNQPHCFSTDPKSSPPRYIVSPSDSFTCFSQIIHSLARTRVGQRSADLQLRPAVTVFETRRRSTCDGLRLN